MAKGNLFLGYGRGAIGDIVLSRINGQQTARARNRRPNNPRTEAQQMQRAKFAAAGLMYRQLTNNLLKLAFETKLPGESDYNAFMRANVRLVPPILREWSTNLRYYMPAPLVLSEGSLPSLEVLNNGIAADIVFSDGPWGSEATTWGVVSQQLVSQYGLRNGDYLTFVWMYRDSQEDGVPTEADLITGFDQYRVDTDSTTEIPVRPSSRTLFGLQVVNASMVSYVPEGTDYSTPQKYCSQTAVIVSRNTSSGLLTSHTEMVLGGPAADAYYTMMNNARYKEDVLTSWDAAPLQILQGSAAK